MEILAIIPVRGGSKGIPGKNIKLLAEKPLVSYTIDAAKKSKYVTRTVVSTEDPKIKEVALAYGAEVLDRPVELAQDETKTAPVMLHVQEELEKQGYKPDVIVLLQATCPLRDEKELDEAFEIFFNSDCDSVFAARHAGLTHALWRQDPNDSSFECMYDYRNRPRRQDTDKHYPMICETGATYIIKTEVFKKVKDFIGEKPAVYLDGQVVDIDTAEDFEKAGELIEKRKNKNLKY
jgi:CMP-N-acetylneuraminic acid synthetase